MRKFSIPNFLKNHGPIITILVLAFLLRIFRLEALTTFTADQGIDLLVVRRILVDHRWTLLGSKTSIAPIYNGPVYYYLLLPFLFFSRLDPLGASWFMIFCYLGTIFLIYLFAKEFLSKQVGLLAAFFFAIWPVAVEYSRFSWYPLPTPFFVILFLYGLAKSIKSKNYYWLILSGFCFGVMMQLHYTNFFLGFLGFLWLLWRAKNKIKALTFFLSSFLIGFLPMILFELRHQFFNTKNLWFFLQQKEAFMFEWHLHYFIAFFPVGFLLLGLILNWLFQKNKIIGFLVTLFLVFLNLSHLNLYRENGYNMPEGWNLTGVRKVSEIIIHDKERDEENFNIAALLDGDTRAYPFRYLLSVGGKEPMGVEEYSKAEVLYVVGRGDIEKILSYPVWEIYSFLPAEVEKIWEIQNGIKLFKLIKK